MIGNMKYTTTAKKATESEKELNSLYGRQSTGARGRSRKIVYKPLVEATPPDINAGAEPAALRSNASMRFTTGIDFWNPMKATRRCATSCGSI